MTYFNKRSSGLLSSLFQRIVSVSGRAPVLGSARCRLHLLHVALTTILNITLLKGKYKTDVSKIIFLLDGGTNN